MLIVENPSNWGPASSWTSRKLLLFYIIIKQIRFSSSWSDFPSILNTSICYKPEGYMLKLQYFEALKLRNILQIKSEFKALLKFNTDHQTSFQILNFCWEFSSVPYYPPPPPPPSHTHTHTFWRQCFTWGNSLTVKLF